MRHSIQLASVYSRVAANFFEVLEPSQAHLTKLAKALHEIHIQ